MPVPGPMNCQVAAELREAITKANTAISAARGVLETLRRKDGELTASIEAATQTLLRENTNKEALDRVLTLLRPAAPLSMDTEKKGPPTGTSICLLLAVVLTTAVLAGVIRPSATQIPLESVDRQLGLLGFAVALAAYLASVGKDRRTAIHEGPNSLRGERVVNLRYVLVAEQMIVFVGLAAAVRLWLAPLFQAAHWLQFAPQAYTDDCIIAGLVAVVGFLAWLHQRQWTRT